jgi:hypothetical protein
MGIEEMSTDTASPTLPIGIPRGASDGMVSVLYGSPSRLRVSGSQSYAWGQAAVKAEAEPGTGSRRVGPRRFDDDGFGDLVVQVVGEDVGPPHLRLRPAVRGRNHPRETETGGNEADLLGEVHDFVRARALRALVEWVELHEEA